VTTRGNLRIYIGATTGVGTTFAMLDEALRRRSRGARVEIGCLTPHDRPRTMALVDELTAGGDPAPVQLDTESLLRSRPNVVLVDDLAGEQPAGARHRHRWQAVDELLDHGIDVITTLTVQHIASLVDPVRRITGTVPTVLIPDGFLARCDQFELIDIAPEAIRRRIAHGNVFGRQFDAVEAELFNSEAFARLRVLLLFWLADRLAGALRPDGAGADLQERVHVALSGEEHGDVVIRRAARLAQRSHAALVGVHVRSDSDPADEHLLAEARRVLTEVGGTFHEVEGTDIAAALLTFAEVDGATQLVLGTSGVHRRLGGLQTRSVVEDVVARTPTVDVHVVSHPTSGRRRSLQIRRTPSVLSARRRTFGLIAGALLLAALTVVLGATRTSLSVSAALGVYLLAVVGISAVGGWLPGLLAAVVAPLLANWFLIEPIHTLRIADPEKAVELAVFVSVALIVSGFVSRSARRAVEAERARREATGLAALAASGPDSLQAITEQLQSTFGLDGVAVLRTEDAHVMAASGPLPPTSPIDADVVRPIADGVVVAVCGRPLTGDEHRVLVVFLQQLAGVMEQRRLAALAAEADGLARADDLRTSILRAVSHDLRSPLAGIKASVSSLRQPDVNWPDEVRDEFLASIEDETDRLTTIVSNLLDMSRLQAGVLSPVVRPVSLEEVVPATVHGIGARAPGVELDLPADLPDVQADPALLERVLANLIGNAVEFSPPGERVLVSAHADHGQVHLYVIDHGRGIRPKDRDVVLQPFHRLSDNERNSGVGLGLAIADGLTTAMGGRLELRDTPGGGLTVAVTLEAAP